MTVGRVITVPNKFSNVSSFDVPNCHNYADRYNPISHEKHPPTAQEP